MFVFMCDLCVPINFVVLCVFTCDGVVSGLGGRVCVVETPVWVGYGGASMGFMVCGPCFGDSCNILCALDVYMASSAALSSLEMIADILKSHTGNSNTFISVYVVF